MVLYPVIDLSGQPNLKCRNSTRCFPILFLLAACTVLAATGCCRENVRQESPRQQGTPAKPADPKPAAPKKPAVLPPGFEKDFIIPDADKDQHGNPVVTRDGSKFDTATGYPYEIWLKEPRLELVLIPAGEFMMGSPDSEEERFNWEGPVHRVTITKPFYMAKYEVTQAQWEAVMGSNPSEFKNVGKDAPVENVLWDDCKAFCKKTTLSLPTEAQWEYTCRAGTKTRFSLGDSDGDLGRAGWFKDNSGSTTHSVGKKSPGTWGLYDMHGNVWEWCEDNWHVNYQGAPTDGSAWLGGSSGRVYRGGSWNLDSKDCRSALRYWFDPVISFDFLGFRPSKPLP